MDGYAFGYSQKYTNKTNWISPAPGGHKKTAAPNKLGATEYGECPQQVRWKAAPNAAKTEKAARLTITTLAPAGREKK